MLGRAKQGTNNAVIQAHTEERQHDAGDAEVRVGDKASGGCRRAIAEAEEE